MTPGVVPSYKISMFEILALSVNIEEIPAVMSASKGVGFSEQIISLLLAALNGSPCVGFVHRCFSIKTWRKQLDVTIPQMSQSVGFGEIYNIHIVLCEVHLRPSKGHDHCTR